MEETAAIARRERLKALRAAHELLSTPDDPPSSAASPPTGDGDGDGDAEDDGDGGGVPLDAGVGSQQATYVFLPFSRGFSGIVSASWNLLKIWEFCLRSGIE